MAQKVRLCNPTHKMKPESSSFFRPKQIADLKGKSVVMLDIGWPVWGQTLPVLAEALKKRYGVTSTAIYNIPRLGPPSSEVEKAVKEAHCVIISLAYGGPEVIGLLENAISIARDGLPTVCIIAEHNRYLWDMLSQSRKVNLPHVSVPFAGEKAIELLPVEKAIELMESIIDDIVRAFRDSPEPQILEEVEPLIEVPDSLDEMYNTMYRLDWTDGLPVIPPTEERVQKMVTYVRKDAKEIVGEMPPFRGVTTVGNIAANAVMAGCLPEHMPVLMAMVRGCQEIDISMSVSLTGGAQAAPMTIINGPIRKELDINCTRGLMGPGRRSNAALGRALQFMLRNIGGATMGIQEPDYLSHPGRYCFCFGENEEESPWEPLSEERGFSQGTSTVTVTGITSVINNGIYILDWRTILDVVSDSLTYFGNYTLGFGGGDSTQWVFMIPEQARRCSEAGLSKQDVKEYVWEKIRIPYSQLPEKMRAIGSPSEVGYPSEAGDQVRSPKSPDDIMVVVAANGPGYYTLTMVGVPPPGLDKVSATTAIT